MSILLQGLQLKGAEIISHNGKRADISVSIESIDYFEDILSPCTTMAIKCNSSNRIVNSLPIRGGEKVVMKLSVPTGEFDADGMRGFYKGLGAAYFKVFPTLAIQFWTIEILTKLSKSSTKI